MTTPTLDDAARRGVRDAADAIGGMHGEDESLLVGVSVPATAANLGPGYDALGVALAIPLVVVAGPRREARVTSTGFGAGELPTGDDNLVWRGVLAWCDHVGAEPPEVSVQVRSAIPLERGMGSSSAAAVAGLVLGRALVGGDGSARDVLAMATALEGHPDNAAAAILGGLTLCLPDGGLHRVAPDDGLRPVLVVPADRQSTDEARGLLPAEVPLATAAGNGARAAATFSGLAGLVPLTVEAMTDHLHEPTRLALMAGTGEVVSALREAGVPASLSGAGPAALAILPARDDDALGRLRDVVAEAAGGTAVEVLPTAWDLSGAVTCPPGPRG